MDGEQYIACSDEQLFLLIQSQDHAAFRTLYERFFPVLYAHTLRKVSDKGAAQDIVQDVFVKLWNNAEQLDIQGKIAGYLYVATKNSIVNYYVSSNRVRDHLEVFARYQNRVEKSPVENLQLKELSILIEQEIEKLPPKMKEIFNLSRKQELSHREIAELLNLSEHTVKKQVANALKILKRKINYTFLLSLLF